MIMDIERLVERLREIADAEGQSERLTWLSESHTLSSLVDQLLSKSEDWYPVRAPFLAALKESLGSKDFLSIEDRCLRDSLVEQLRLSGIEVVTDKLRAERTLSERSSFKASRAYHGSGSSFDRFDLSFNQTGQGVNSYGYGIYLTEVESIARCYADEYQGLEILKRGELVRTDSGNAPWRLVKNLHEEHDGDIDSMRAEAQKAFLGSRGDKMASVWLWVSQALGAEGEDGIELKPARYLYTVDIPEDDGVCYLAWERPVDEELSEAVLDELSNQPADRSRLVDRWLDSELSADDEFLDTLSEEEREDLRQHCYSSYLPSDVRRYYLELYTDLQNDVTGKSLYQQIGAIFESEEVASAFLRDMGIIGISYPAQFMVLDGGRSDGARNYVMFDERDIEVRDRLRFFRKDDDTLYGFTDGKRIFIDEEIAPAETPIHEYAHLWVAAYRLSHKAEWDRLCEEQKDGPLWKETAQRYPELLKDADILEELVATYVGLTGRERLSKDDRLLRGMEDTEKRWFSSLRTLVSEIWGWVKGLFLKEASITLDKLSFLVVDDLLSHRDPTSQVERSNSRVFGSSYSR